MLKIIFYFVLPVLFVALLWQANDRTIDKFAFASYDQFSLSLFLLMFANKQVALQEHIWPKSSIVFDPLFTKEVNNANRHVWEWEMEPNEKYQQGANDNSGSNTR